MECRIEISLPAAPEAQNVQATSRVIRGIRAVAGDRIVGVATVIGGNYWGLRRSPRSWPSMAQCWRRRIA